MKVYEELEQHYLSASEDNKNSRYSMGAAAHQVQEQFGKSGLLQLSQTAHKKLFTLLTEIAVFRIWPLTEGRPRLTWAHLALLSGLPEEEQEEWADRAEDNNWSAADLRRQVSSAKGQVGNPDKVVARANATSEKMKEIIDEAAVVGKLPEVVDRAKSVAQYAEAKVRSQ